MGRILSRVVIAVIGAAVLAAVVGAAPTQAVVASGWPNDFNGDGYADLVGIDDLACDFYAGGAANVIYGGASGLTATGNQRVWNDCIFQEWFGSSMTAGDFDGNGADDLVVGVPRRTVGGRAEAGGVFVYPGGNSGLTDATTFQLHQDTSSITDTAEAQDRFGSQIEGRGDYNGDGYDDLVLTVPGEDLGTTVNCGAVHVIYSRGATGLRGTVSNVVLSQNTPGVADLNESGDGGSLGIVTGRFDADARDDLAIAYSSEQYYFSGLHRSGVVHLLKGSSSGLTSTGSQYWSAASPGIPGYPHTRSLGSQMVAGDFGKSASTDLTLGASEGIMVLYGATTGLTSTGAQLWAPYSDGLPGEHDATDGFGAGLGAANYGKSSHADLAIGVPWETPGGVIKVLYGTSGGLRATGAQLWSLSSPDIEGEPFQGEDCCFGVDVL